MEKFPSTTGETTDKPFLGTTKDGKSVYDRPDSHFHPEGGLTKEILASAISVISTDNQIVKGETVKFNGIVGKNNCVEVGPEDEIVMVYRTNRSGQTPMVKNREPSDCDTVHVILLKNEENENEYCMLTAFIGESTPKEPWDPYIKSEEERTESEKFWKTHALIYNEDLIDKERTKI